LRRRPHMAFEGPLERGDARHRLLILGRNHLLSESSDRDLMVTNRASEHFAFWPLDFVEINPRSRFLQ
jgi:hypothetical protein